MRSSTHESFVAGTLWRTIMRNKNKIPQLPPVRHVRLVMPDALYKEVGHRLVEAGPTVSISDVIVELVTNGLAKLPDQPSEARIATPSGGVR